MDFGLAAFAAAPERQTRDEPLDRMDAVQTPEKLPRRSTVARILADRGDMLVVTGLGSPTYDCAAAGDHPLNFYLWGAMGSAVPVGLGLALAQPGRRVLVLTGDGEILMGLGALATVAVKKPANLAIAVIDNEHYGETGMQRTHTHAGVDLAAIAGSCGFSLAVTIREASELDAATAALRRGTGPVLVVLKVAPTREPLVLPPRDGHFLKTRFRQALLGADAASP
jgi:thiamine pyrophosphate-dependent acetolactate synthase large subunit-like protein